VFVSDWMGGQVDSLSKRRSVTEIEGDHISEDARPLRIAETSKSHDALVRARSQRSSNAVNCL
jgi:hypothetical protein